MIVVDSSVWINVLRGIEGADVAALRKLEHPQHVVVGDLVLLEVLRGARDGSHAAEMERYLRQFQLARMLDLDLARLAAGNYRLLRERGITVRKTVDLIIGTFCIAHGHVLLHADRDFEPMERHLGLGVVR